jgi:uncharacterized protein (TIGR03083 family)
MVLTIDIEPARAACAGSVTAFVRAVESVSEHDLLASSRCHGWTRMEVLTHLLAGWQDMLGGMVSQVDQVPTVDAASYWSAFEAQYGNADPVAVLMSQRRRSTAYLRPASALEQLRDVATSLSRGITLLPDQPVLWQGQVFTAGDFLAVWAVENAVHHLDLQVSTPVPQDALAIARQTIETIIRTALPAQWNDERAVLVGTGRVAVPEELSSLAPVLPALG